MEPPQKPRRLRMGLSKSEKVTPLLKMATGSTCTSTPKAKLPQPVLEIDDSPDPLSREDVPGPALYARQGKGIGDGLRSEINLQKRRANMATRNTTSSVDVVVSVGGGTLSEGRMGRQGSMEPISRKAKGEKREGDLKGNGNEGGDLGVVQRRSGRITARKAVRTEAGPVEAVKDKSKNSHGRSTQRNGGKGGYDKKGYYNMTEPGSASEDEDLGFKVPAKTVPSTSKTATSLSTTVGAVALEKATRSTRSIKPTTMQNGVEAGRGGKMETKSKGRASAENQESSEASLTKSDTTNSYSNSSISTENEPVVLDDLECDRAGSDYWGPGRPVKKGGVIVFKGKRAQKYEKGKTLRRQEQKPPQPVKSGKKGAKEEEVVLSEHKWLDPLSYITPRQQKKAETEVIDIVEFVNPIVRYNIAQSPDHLEGHKFTNGSTKTHNTRAGSNEIINLTTPTPLKKRRTSISTRYLYDPELSPLTSPSSSPEPSYDIDTSYVSLTVENPRVCCICRENLSKSFLSAHPHSTSLYSNVQHQIDRCRLHKRFSAEEESKAKGYPATCIDWKSLPRRIDVHIPYLVEILEQKRHSAFRDAMGEDMKIVGVGRSSSKGTGNDKGKDRSKGKRKLIETDWQSHTPGYYGPRGAHVMLETIMRKMANQIRDVGTNDRLIAGGGVSAFAQSVLVPELGVHLVMEDLKVGEDEARLVMRETVEMGELLNDEDEEGEAPGDYFDDSDGEGSGQWVTV